MLQHTPVSALRTLAKWARWPLVVICTLNVEKLAEHLEWDDYLFSALGSWGPSVARAFEFLASAWVQYPALFLLGLSLGVWLDARLKRNEHQFQSTSVAQLDRDILATEAEKLSGEIARFIAQYDTRARLLMVGDIQDQARKHDRIEQIRGQMREAYSEIYYTRVTQVFNKSQKLIPLNRDMFRWLRGSVEGFDLDNLPENLAALATELRFSHPNIPTYSPKDEEFDRVTQLKRQKAKAAEAPSLPSPPAPATETPP